VFFLDCITRTEGHSYGDLHERPLVAQHVDLDFAALYEQSLENQLEAYLTVPFDDVEAYIPEWKLTTHISPVPESIETLPFIVNDLSIVRTEKSEEASATDLAASTVHEFFRGQTEPRGNVDDQQNNHSRIQLAPVESREHTWVGDAIPIGASKALPEAFHNRLTRTPTEGDISITVVCNDSQMVAERDTVDEIYGSREELPFDVIIHENVTKDEFCELLSLQTDFLHYIGHVDDHGFRCANGSVSAASLNTVGVIAFLLNACNSYDEGVNLVKAGAVGGVVTLSDVINSGAIRIGHGLAQLLNRGFPLQAALQIARDESIIGGQYIVVGDGGIEVAQAENGVPNLCLIDSNDGSYSVEVKTYQTTQLSMGSLVLPYISDNDSLFLNGSTLQQFTVSSNELGKLLNLEDTPVIIDNDLRWSSYELASEL